ncbi:MAG: hypothetical protein LC753_09575 [Acidobacteria bacterium]|nr:hypothetical protein [Acidobacteriota bacterium]
MAFNWLTAGQIAFSAGSAFLNYLQVGRDDREREHDRELILAAIRSMREDILDTLNLLAVNEFRGDLEGFQSTYEAYDPDPNDPVEENRLVRLIDDSARVLGRLGANLDTVGSNPDLALEAWTVYVPLLYLRAQAMTERQVTYGNSEVRDEQYICGSTRDPRGVQKCQDSRRSIMESSYQRFPGVKQITESREQVQLARDAVDTRSALDRLTQAGVLVGPIIFEGGHFRRVAPEPGEIAAGNDWFT